jgi:hypothetical protein
MHGLIQMTPMKLLGRVFIIALVLMTVVSVSCSDDTAGYPPSGTMAASTGTDPFVCPGQCSPPLPGPEWIGPVSFWTGPSSEEPAEHCPTKVWGPAYYGFEKNEAAPHTCPTCACDLPEQVCTVPGDWTVSSAVCGDSSGVTTPFTSADGWNGACTTENAIPAGKLCDGKPCVRSVTFPHPELTSCTPRTIGQPVFPPADLGQIAVACYPGLKEPIPPCASPDETCVPPLPEGYDLCIWHEFDVPCEGVWATSGKRYVRYDAEGDTRGCTPCACDKPAGAICGAHLAVHNDAACTGAGASTTISSQEPDACINVAAGIALGSKAWKIMSSQPGTCGPPSGGEPTGGLPLGIQGTFCCL